MSKKRTSKTIRWDNWHFRLPNPEDQVAVIERFKQSGAKSKTEFAIAQLLQEKIYTPTIRQPSQDNIINKEYVEELREYVTQINKIGILYNQVVRALNKYHTPPFAKQMISKLEKYTFQLVELQKQILQESIKLKDSSHGITKKTLKK